MRLAISILKNSNPSSPCNGATSAITATDVDVNIKINGVTIVSGQLSSPTIAPIIVNDSSGEEISCTGTYGGVPQPNVLLLNIPMLNTWNYVDVTISVTNNTGTTYNNYNNIFRVYGYDLGNDVSYTGNPKFEIVMVQNSPNKAYSSVIAYRKPFTDVILYYKGDSSSYNTVEYYDDSGNLLTSIPNGTITSSDTLLFVQRTTYIYSTGGVTTTDICEETTENTINSFKWIPDFELKSNCLTDCNNECISTLSGNEAHLEIDYTTLDTVNIDNVQSYPFYNQGISLGLYDNSGTLISEENFIFYAIYGTSVYDFNNYIITYTLPDIGDYVVKGCLSIFGYPPLMQKSGTIIAGDYQILSIVGGADFSNTNVPGDTAVGDIITVPTDVAPNSWGNGSIVPVIASGNITSGKFYRITRLDSGTPDFDNLTGHTSLVNDIFYSDGTSPTSWGNYPVGSERGAICEVLPIYICCNTLIITGCNPYEITRSDCNSFIVNNRSASTISYTVDMITDSGWVNIVPSTDITAFSTSDIELTLDGTYRFNITDGIISENYIKFSYCNIQTCKENYLKSLICCNAEGNCDDCNDSDCSHKNIYDFNAFSIIMNTYFALLNKELETNYVYSDSEIEDSDKITELYTIQQTIDRANEYCETCNKPCSNC